MPTFIDRIHPAHQTHPVAIIDIGSNSVRMVVYHALQRVPLPLFNEKYMCSLGRDMASTGLLYAPGKQLAEQVLLRFLAIAQRLKVTNIDVLATAALRDAKDSDEFVQQLESLLNQKIRIISGEHEAQLAAFGIISSIHAPKGIVADMGGGSMELAHIKDGAIATKHTLPMGGLLMANRYGNDTASLQKVYRKALRNIDWFAAAKEKILYAIGGSFRAIAKAHMRQSNYPLPILHGYRMSCDTLKNWVEYLCQYPPDMLGDIPGIAKKRSDTIIPAAIALHELMECSNATQVIFSVSGIREGFLHTQLNADIASEDPLLASASELAAMAGRHGSYASELYHWMSPLFVEESHKHDRLRQAFCMLTEIAWTIDPNFRGEWAYQRIIQSSIKGINHKERVMLALAMYYRHESQSKEERSEFSLMDDAERLWAKTLGMAANVAALISAGRAGTLGSSRFEIKHPIIHLLLEDDIADMRSALLEKRLDGLGESFSALRKFRI